MSNIKTSSIVIEIFNAITHGLGVIFSIIAIIFLIKKGIFLSSNKAITAYVVYGISMILLFLSSTLCHSLTFSKYATFFQKLDHSTIYLLIAGTYTPYLLLSIGGILGNIFLSLIWGLAIIGIFFEIVTLGKYPKISIFLYLFSGWIIIFIFRPLINSLHSHGLLFLSLGGISYSIGALFFYIKIEWFHIIWHLFVLAGSSLMFFSIFLYV